jgi:hypothetical protein
MRDQRQTQSPWKTRSTPWGVEPQSQQLAFGDFLCSSPSEVLERVTETKEDDDLPLLVRS